MPLSQDEKNAKLLREQIAKIPENKRCADCTAKGPVYANTTFNTFVCTACSGIHREFNHRVKSISMASFKPEEVKGLLEGGNGVARQIWMARWSASDFPEPDPGDPERLRQFIRLKYIDKKWVAGSGGQNVTNTTSKKVATGKKDLEVPKAEPLTNILGNDIPPMQVRSSNNATSSPKQGSSGWASFENVSWNSGSSTVTPHQQNASLWENAPPVQNSNTGLEGLLFPSQEQAQRIEQEKLAKAQEEQTKKKSNDLLAQLGTMYQQQAQVNQQQILQQQLLQQQQIMMQMAQQQGLTPQQQQLYLQQLMRQFPGQVQPGQQLPPQIPVQMPGQMPGQMPAQPPFITHSVAAVPYGQPLGGIPVQQAGFGISTSPTSFGSMGSVGASPNVFAESPKPPEPVQPPKHDPFASLSPFSGGASVKSNVSGPAKAPTSPTTNQPNDPFGFGATPVAPQKNDMTDFFGGQPVQRAQEVNPFGISQPANTQSQGDFNPFF